MLRSLAWDGEEASEQPGRISLAAALECLEQMDYLIEGEFDDLVRTIVPASAKEGALDLQDVIKVIRCSWITRHDWLELRKK